MADYIIKWCQNVIILDYDTLMNLPAAAIIKQPNLSFFEYLSFLEESVKNILLLLSDQFSNIAKVSHSNRNIWNHLLVTTSHTRSQPL